MAISHPGMANTSGPLPAVSAIPDGQIHFFIMIPLPCERRQPPLLGEQRVNPGDAAGRHTHVYRCECGLPAPEKTHACGDEGAALTRRPLHCAAALSSASVCSFLAFPGS